jgi:hypothetical protein
MKQGLLWLLIAGIIVLVYAFYPSRHSSSDLKVEPHAAEEIEKAKRR